MNKNVPTIIKKISLKNLIRIDAALEGNWNPTTTAIWTRKNGFIGFSKAKKSHRVFKPSIELYFKDSWIGIRCFKRIKNKNVFNEKLAMSIINFVEDKLKITKFLNK